MTDKLREKMAPLIEAADDDQKAIIEGLLSVIDHHSSRKDYDFWFRKINALCSLAAFVASMGADFDGSTDK